MISPTELIKHLHAAFGETMELPIAFWRSDEPLAENEKIGGCFFKGLKSVRAGEPLNLCEENVGCGGGKFYLGLFDPSVRPHVGADELGFSIPASRLRAMAETIDKCFLSGSTATSTSIASTERTSMWAMMSSST